MVSPSVNDREESVQIPILTPYGSSEAEFNFLEGQFEQTLHTATKALKTVNGSGTDLDRFRLLGFGAAASLSSGDLEKARGFLSPMGNYFEKMGPFDQVNYHMLMAWTALLREDFYQVARYQSQLQSLMKLGTPVQIAIGHYIMFQSFIGQGEIKKATLHLRKVSQLGRRMKSAMLVFMFLLSEAQLLMAQGKMAMGLRSLRKALSLGKEKGYVNFWVWQPKVMAGLCVQALEHHIEPGYVKMLVKKRELIPEKPPIEVEHWPWRVKIYTLGRFGIVIDGIPLRFPVKAQEKPLALLKVLIALGGRDVSEEKVSYTLWPEAEGDKAHNALATTLKRLRKLMGTKEAILLNDGRLTLDPRQCWTDIWAFERFLGASERHSKVGQMESALKSFEKSSGLYQASFLTDDLHESWAIQLRERLRSRFIRQLCGISDVLCEQGKYKQAMAYLQKGLELDELVEALYQRIMTCHQSLGQHAEAYSTYKRLKRVLSLTFGIRPSPKTEAIIQSIRKH